ncbi:hypothetical protein KPH14_007434 [Odynerus spinipes]|uniref:DC-STAMP domain-containing protein 2 n=1 Tax=Odynerus spinipes TaxID=1348599 RepID=A0AAD9RAK1_9HYME|nr:hypothetical protein KPH14_007434 [Odynerus spinipes]
MAFFQLVLKAHRLERLRRTYEDEKLRSIQLSKGAKSLTWRQRLRYKKLRCKRKVKDFWSKITSFPEDSWLHKKAVLLRTDGTFENYILKSFFGFLGGILLTYVFFIFFVFQLNFSLTSATLLCSVIGVILTLGLAFSYKVRCIVFLLLPLFFSKRGRQALIAYAFILTLTGPGKNALRNTSVLTESLICGQEQLKEAIKSVIDLIKQPFYALKEAITKVIKTVRVIVRKIKETLVAIKRLVLSILNVITAVFQWLGSIVNICNKRLGTPFDRCQRVFEGAVADCRAKLGPIFGEICNLTYVVSSLCWIVKPLDFICMLVSYVADAIVDAVKKSMVQQPNSVGVYVSGNGYLADLYRSIVKAFTPHMQDVEINSVPCLPDPLPPDFDGYIRILSLIAFCWIMVVFEPYSLRLRTIVMCQYHPDRAKQRAAWLYNHIMRSRGSFVKFARRQLRRKFGINNKEQMERITLKQRFIAVCPFLKKLFSQKESSCLLCGARQRDDTNPHIKCPTPGCIGLFCMECFADLQNICTICRSPLEYGDLSDMSEEKDSSDDQLKITEGKKLKLLEDTKKVKKEEEVKEMEEEEFEEEEFEEDEEYIEEIQPEYEEEVEEPEKYVHMVRKLEKKDVGEQTDGRESEDYGERSSTSVYSYTYQDESPPPEPEDYKRVIPFRDVEAQRIRDDVTIQIFNDPIARSITWSSDTTPSCFVVRAHRKVRRRLKSRSRSLAVCKDSSSSIDSEEIKEDEVIHIEVDDGSKELLIRDRRDKEKDSRVKRIIAAVSRVPWLGGRGRKGLQSRRPSLINRVMKMLNGKRSTSPVQTYRRIISKQCDDEETSTSSSYSSTFSDGEEDDDRSGGPVRARAIGRHVDWEDPEDIISSQNYEENKVSRHTKMDDINLRYPCEKQFATKDLPRYLEPISKSTSYYEIDETEDSRSSCKCGRTGEDINVLSDARMSLDSRKTDTWNIIGEDQSQNSTPYTSERALLEILNEAKEKEMKDQSSQTTSSQTEETFIPKKETDTHTSRNYDKHLNTETERNTMKQKQERKKDTRRSDPKKTHFYDSLAGLELYGVEGKTKRSDKYLRKRIEYNDEEEEEEEDEGEDDEEEDEDEEEDDEDDEEEREHDKEKISKVNKKTPIHSRAISSYKVNVGTDLPDQDKGVQTKSIKRKKIMKNDKSKRMKKSKDDKSKPVLHGLTEDNEWKGRQWKKCIEEYKKRHKRHKKSPSNSDGKRHPKKHGYKGKSMIMDKLYLKRKSHKKERTSHRHTCDEALQFPENERRNWHAHESFYPKDNQRQFISGFIPIMCPEHVQTYKPYYDPREGGPSYGQHDSKICQREPYYRRDEDDQTKVFRADEDTRFSGCSADHVEHVATSTDNKQSSSEEDELVSTSEQYQQDVHNCMRKMYKVAAPPEKFRIPMLRKYLPMYQKSQLIEELKEHDKMRLIREREARRCVTSNPVKPTKLPFVVKMEEEQALSDTCVDCDRGRHANHPLTQAARNEKLPYQETQAFKQLTKEFRRRTLSTKRVENLREAEPLISASRNADKSKEVEQLFPPDEKCRKENFVSNITNRIANAFKFKNYKNRKMFKLGKLLCQKKPRLSEIENDKDEHQEQGIQYSETIFQQNVHNKERKPSFSLKNDENVLADQTESISNIVQDVQKQPSDEQDEMAEENEEMLNYAKRIEESRESIAKSKKYYSDDACNMDTCSKQECASNTCNRVIDKKKIADKEIDPSKLTEIINSSIKEAMQTIIKQCVMDDSRVSSLEKKVNQERPKIQAIVKRDDDEKYVSRKRYYPCDCSRKYEKQPRALKTIKKCAKDSYDGSTVSKYHPVKEISREKGTKKHSKSSKNVKTDNRRMTGNVNIYICSEANENAQRKEKQKEKSESCTESSSETTTERTNSTCVRTSSVLSSKLVSGIQKRRQKSQEEGSDHYFHAREHRAVRSDDSNNICYDKYDSSMTLKQDDCLELSTLSSRSTEIGSMTSSISSTRDGCCCQDTVSSYIDMHRQDLMRLKPKFMGYDDEPDQNLCTARIFPQNSGREEVGDSWMQRSVCVNKPHLHRQDSSNHSIVQRRNYRGDACKCCCREKVDCKHNRAAKKRSSFDISHEKGLHRKWSRCSCIVEEEEEEQCPNFPIKKEVTEEKWTVCKNNLGDSKRENCQECAIHTNLNNSNETSQDVLVENEDTVKSVNRQEKSIDNANETSSMSNARETNRDAPQRKNEVSNVSRTPVSPPKVGLVLKKSRLHNAIEKQKLQQRNKDIKKEKNLSEEKSFFGRSIKRAMSLVKQDKVRTSVNNNKDNEENVQTKTVNSPTMLKSDQNNNSEIKRLSKTDVPVTQGIRYEHRASTPLTQEIKALDITKNEKVQKIETNKRPKSRLETILAGRKGLQPVKTKLIENKKSELPGNRNQTENIKDTKEETKPVKDKNETGDFQKDISSTKIEFDNEPEQQELAEAAGYPCDKRSFESTVNRCCCCCLPVVDCTCNLKEISTTCIVPKFVTKDVCSPMFDCHRVVNKCECGKPAVCENCCKNGNVIRCDVPCIECNKPKEKCHCIPTCVDCCNSNCQHACNETIICVYCEHPRDKCVCRAPIRKCSYCGLSFDICKCHELCDGRRIVMDHDNDRKICVTAWKPKPEVRRYFSRDFNDFRSDSIDECYCKSHKNCGYTDLPYQRSSAFSDVMSELQQKMSDYVCCERCKKSPCCCRRNFDKKMEIEDRKGRCYVSSKQRQRSRSPDLDHVRTKSPSNNRCGPERTMQRRTLPPSRICYSCRTSPCRCKKGRSTTKRPRAKCYYCKSCPCTCISAREVNKSRSCKYGDSPYRVKEKEKVLCGKAFDDARKKKEEKVFRTRESNTCVCPLTKPY